MENATFWDILCKGGVHLGKIRPFCGFVVILDRPIVLMLSNLKSGLCETLSNERHSIRRCYSPSSESYGRHNITKYICHPSNTLHWYLFKTSHDSTLYMKRISLRYFLNFCCKGIKKRWWLIDESAKRNPFSLGML